MASLYDRPDLYDLIGPPDPAMETFYVEVARAAGPRVLDVACGTGRLTIPLAQAGLEATGGDLSPAMVDAARQKAAGAIAVDFRELDMRHFELRQQFDTILIGANSLLHLHTGDDFAGFFRSIRRHLAPNGRFAFDIFVPSVAMLARNPAERHPVGTFNHGPFGAVTWEETNNYDPIRQISHITWYWSTPDQRDVWQAPLELRQIFPQELPMLLAINGFRLAERYGDFDRSPFGSGSWRQVCIATPA